MHDTRDMGAVVMLLALMGIILLLATIFGASLFEFVHQQ
jgi:hypothetical protein